jgi:hypothetical protein
VTLLWDHPSTARLPIGNDNGGYLKEYPHQSKLDNYAKDQRNKFGDQASQLMPLCANARKIVDTAM